MVALQIRDVPERTRDVLAARARARGLSLQAFLLALVEDEARRTHNADVLGRFAGRSDGSRVGPGVTAADVRAARAERAQEAAEPDGGR